MGSHKALILALAVGCISAAAPRLGVADTLPGQCAGNSPTETFRAVGAFDGSMIKTAEGEVIRLAGIVTPDEFDQDFEAGQRAEKVLHDLVAGKTITVRRRAGGRDRYSRIVGQVELADGSQWVQAAIVAAGVVRVAPHVGAGNCADALLVLERQARSKKAGLWAEPRFQVFGSQDTAGLTAAEGRFMLVEGVVRRIGESGGRIYLDFGRRFNEDFSVIVPRDAHKAFTSTGIDLRSLEGARVRVRGIVTLRGGPAIELRDPAAMERLKADGA